MKIKNLLLTSSLVLITACGSSTDKLLKNRAPIAEAGDDKFITTESEVSLLGIATDEDNDIDTILWKQIAGPTQVEINNSGTLEPSFATPAQNGAYNFELKVTDKKGNVATDQLSVIIDAYSGYWLTPDRGTVVSFGSEIITEYQYTTAVNTTLTQSKCLISSELSRSETEEKHAFELSDDKLTLQIDTLSYSRLEQALPESCLAENLTKTIESDDYVQSPLEILDIAWNNLNEYYPFFQIRGITQEEWNLKYSDIANQVNNEMSDDEIFDMVAELLSSFEETVINNVEIGGDGHVSVLRTYPDSDEEDDYSAISDDVFTKQLQPECEQQQLSEEACGEYMEEAMESYLSNIVNYLDDSSLTIINGKEDGAITAFGQVADQPIGYILFQSMADVIPDDVGEDVSYIEAIEGMMDVIITGANEAQLESMIIDLRFNGGGYDDVAESIASYFIENNTDVATIQTRTDGDTVDNAVLSESRTVSIQPNTEHHFDGNIIVLTSRSTGSAAEMLTGFLSTNPETVRIGENTRGNFSSELWRLLPNGWLFSQSAEVTKLADANGNFTNYEGIGYPVSPNMETPFFTLDDRENQKDSAIEKAISYLMNIK